MHLLLVEDDPSVAHGVAAGLRLHGFTVDHAETAAAAQAALAASEFDLAVLDLGLPDGDGMDLLARWRARGIGMPLLVLTARDAVSDRVRGLQAGADDYLLKPFESIMLVVERVKHAITHRRTQLEREQLSNTLRELEKSLRKSESTAFQKVTELDLLQNVLELKISDATQELELKLASLQGDLEQEREKRAALKKTLLELAESADEKLKKRLQAEAEILG